MGSRQLKLGSIMSYAQMGLSIVIGLIYTPIMIRLLGQSEYGLYNTVSSTISILSVLNLGFTSSYIRYFAKYRVENDNDSIKKLNGLFLIIFCIIGFVALVCGLIMTFNLDLVFDRGLTTAEYRIAKVLMLLMTINMAMSFPKSVFTSIISAHEEFVFLRVVSIVDVIISHALILIVLLLGYRSIAMVIVSSVMSVMSFAVYIYYVVYRLKNKFVFHHFEKGLFKDLFVYTSFLAINLVVDQINNNIDKMLLGRFRGTSDVAIYAVGFALYGYYMMFSTSVSGIFTPRVHSIIRRDEHQQPKLKEELTSLFTKVGRIQFLVLALVATGVVFFGRYFITAIWAGPGYEDSYIVALLLIIPATIPFIQNLGIEIQRAQNKHKFRSIAYAMMAVVNLLISIYLCKRYGAVGSAVGTAISFVLANGLVMNLYYQKKCNIDIVVFWKSIISLSRGLLIPIIVGIFIFSRFTYRGVIDYLVAVMVYSAIYAVSMWMFGMNLYEKQLIISAFVKLQKKRKNRYE